MRLQGRIVVVTGAAQGIGAACAVQAAREGAAVMLSDISGQGEPVAERIRGDGGRAVFHCADTADARAITGLLDAAEAAFGLVDGCIAAAGIAPHTDFLDVPEAEFMRVLAVNLTGPFLLGQQVARRLTQAGKPGAIVNITSTSARLAGPQQAAYCASKGGLDSLTRVMAVALARQGIRVNALAPGPTRTPLLDGASASAKTAVLARTPLGRFCEPKEQAVVAAFLLSDEASYMTGETVYVDGGRTALNYTMPV